MKDATREKALKLEVAKRYMEAAEAYREIGLLEKSAYMYQKANRPELAAALFEENKQSARAAEVWLKIGRNIEAGEALERAGDYVAAAKSFILGQELNRGAEMYIRAKQYKDAGEIYLVLKNYLNAGECFEKAGDLKRSASAYGRIADSDEITKLKNKEDMNRIAKILQQVQNFEKAAEIYIHSKDVVEAILMYIRIGELAPSARLYSNCQGDVGFDLIRLIPRKGDAYKNFADMFYLARDYAKAGRVYEDFGELARAGECYEKCDNYYDAAECYIRAKESERAALCFERAGEHLRAGELFCEAGNRLMAARNYERAGDFFRSGELFHRMERYDKAIDLLQKIGEDNQNYLKSSAIIADILREKGYLDLALERYERIVEKEPLGEESLPFYYNLSLILAEKGRYDDAERLLKEVANFRLNYKDTLQKLAEIKRAKEDFAKGKTALGDDLKSVRQTTESSETAKQKISQAEALAQTRIVGRMDGFEFLKNTPIFEDLTLDEMREFWAICETREYKPEKIIIREGVPGEALYIIRQGCVRVVKEKKEGEEILTILYPGDHFGELSLINDAPTTATVKAAEDVVAFAITREKYAKLLGSSDRLALRIYRAFIRTLARRLIRTTDDFVAFRRAVTEESEE